MDKRFSAGWSKHADFLLIDILALEMAGVVASLLRFGYVAFFSDGLYRQIALMLIILNCCAALFDETYRGVLRRGYLKELKNSFKHILMVIGLLLLCLYMMKQGAEMSRVFFLYLTMFSILFSWLFRCILKKLAGKIHQQKSNMIVLVSAQLAERSLELLAESKANVVGVCIFDKDCTGQTIAGIPVVASTETLLDYIKKNVVDDLFIRLDHGEKLSDQFMDICVNMGVSTHVSLAYSENDDRGQMVERIGKYTVLTRCIYIASARQLFLKRLVDICGGLAGVIVTGLAAILVGPAIYLASPGPIFFTQTRVGRNGRKFKIYKFRSMYMDAEERKKELMGQNKIANGMMFKVDNDPRIIKGIGHFIRKYSIDELPQLWNVLKGEMSLVGTRPPTVEEYEKYDYHHKARLAIKPGITGMWQVSGRSNITDFEEVVRLDTQYITSWSLGVDVKILMKTIKVVLMGDGAE